LKWRTAIASNNRYWRNSSPLTPSRKINEARLAPFTTAETDGESSTLSRSADCAECAASVGTENACSKTNCLAPIRQGKMTHLTERRQPH